MKVTSPSMSHAQLLSVLPNQHHNQSHIHDGADGSGTVDTASLANHNKANHDALGINADTVDSEHVADIVTNSRVKAHFPDTIAAILNDHNKVNHDSLNINADTLDGYHAAGIQPTVLASGNFTLASLVDAIGVAGHDGANTIFRILKPDLSLAQLVLTGYLGYAYAELRMASTSDCYYKIMQSK